MLICLRSFESLSDVEGMEEKVKSSLNLTAGKYEMVEVPMYFGSDSESETNIPTFFIH
jgi:hypothetical protein